MVKRGHEVDIEYSKKKILSMLNSYLGYNAVEKLKFVSFEGNDGVFKEKGLDIISDKKILGDFGLFREIDLALVLNRLRGFVVNQNEEQ